MNTKEIVIDEDDFSLIYNLVRENNIESFKAEWYMGGIELSFYPELEYDEFEDDFNELVSNLISDLEIIWNVDFEKIIITDKLIECTIQETINEPKLNDDSIENYNYIEENLIKHIQAKKKLDITDLETILNIEQTGNFKNNEYLCKNFELTIFNDDNEININDNTSSNIVSKTIHELLCDMYSKLQKTTSYEFICEDGVLTLNLFSEKVHLKIFK